ncbi:MAG: hypothetical protein GY946_13575, partial [bacterium]|nr:hypothetical protein [bacterium]
LQRLMLRMLEKPVWEFWEEVSRSQPEHDPDWSGPQKGWRDPVRDKNIMYSGHVAHMAALYEMLYRDLRWDSPGALTFRWDEDEAFVYDLPKLIDLLHKQMTTNAWGGIECEINAVFPECNQHPILAFQLFDHMHGTRSFEARHSFLELFEQAPMVDPETHEVVAFYRVKQEDVLANRNPRVGMPRDLLLWPMVKLGLFSFDSPSACGWTGAFMHAWDPERVELHYPAQKTHHVVPADEGGGVRPGHDLTPELSVGYFATLAVEVGDEETARGLLAWADDHYEPFWEEGALRYPLRREMDEAPTHRLTGKLLAMARSNRPDGLRRLHGEPWDDDDFAHPLLAEVEFPKVVVRQAFWDAPRKTLRISLEPGNDPVGRTSFRLVSLDPQQGYSLVRDGEVVATLEPDQPVATHQDTLGSSGEVRRLANDAIEVSIPLQGPTHFELRASPWTATQTASATD